MGEFLQKNGVLIMERIMLLDKDMPNIGLTFRITTKGDEYELVKEFVEFYIDMFKRINRKKATNKMSYYSVNLPSYTIGEGCYKEIPHTTRFYGKTAVVIGGKIAMSKAKDKILEGIKDSDVEILDFIWYGGDSTYENGNALIDMDVVKKADMIFAVGGGRACDTCKYVANEMDKPLFCFPTVASNCASVTAISVIYNPDGSFREYYYPKNANHTFIESSIIADSPEELLWAGIGDALSKECEAVFASKEDELSHTPMMGVQLSKICTTPLVEYGKKALDDLRANKVSYELEQVALDIIISTGLVSNMVSAAPKYYYNSSLAHCVYYGSTVTKGGEKHLHGEIVSLGVLCLLTFGKEYEERERIAKFNLSMGLPVCFEDIEITEDDFDAMAEKAMTTTEWDFKPENAGVTKESFIQCMKETDEYGRSIKF